MCGNVTRISKRIIYLDEDDKRIQAIMRKAVNNEEDINEEEGDSKNTNAIRYIKPIKRNGGIKAPRKAIDIQIINDIQQSQIQLYYNVGMKKIKPKNKYKILVFK